MKHIQPRDLIFRRFGWTLATAGFFSGVAMRMLNQPVEAQLMFLGTMLLGLGMVIVDRMDHIIDALERLDSQG